ncbi:RAMP superfamily protein [Clostridium acetireducens DSM 10703]|jgi:CRISPR-associated protein Csm3|uniref:RAMP superfamily protein n=1 Tax=Clostridium acetireducens DSM 10703 TaxID=1121290 RepID=A0A1E8F0T2_9CLOT|nr:RAMP superfamily CRISPR-associated protein [Clostridium acetireducens]OFI07059.1 RAMP superfamily protein [Clostridium acetireducens DSM 10703]
MHKCKYMIKLNFKSPFNINTGEGENDFINKYTVKLRGKPYIPGSTIKGKIKSNFYKISDFKHKDNNESCNCPMCKLFGKSGNSPSKICVDNFETKEESKISIKTSNSIDRFRKVSKDGALFTEEQCYNKEFLGEVSIVFDEETKIYKEELEMAIKMIDFIGGSKSRGSGNVEVSFEEVK